MPSEKNACSACHRADGTHTPGCATNRQGKAVRGRCMGKAKARAGHKKRKPLTRNDPKAKPTRADLAAAVATHRSAEARAIALERIEVDLVDARARQVAIQAEVTVLERLAAGLGAAR